MQRRHRIYIAIALFFSLMLHLSFFGGVVWLAPLFEHKPPEVIEVSLDPEGAILDALTPNKQTIVRQAIVPEKMKMPEDETLARFLSEQKQRVREESQAAQTGMTANRPGQGPAKNTAPARAQAKEQQKNQSDVLDKEGYQRVDISRELQEMNRASQGASTVGEALPRDVKVGSFTALNTDRYLFYTFYARLEELIRYRWETRVEQALANFDRPTLSQLGNRHWVTHVEFLLDKKGYLQKALIMKESGVPAFDLAGVNAFKDARVFPNPPKEMIQEDGYIHIKFGFTVNFSPPAIVNRN